MSEGMVSEGIVAWADAGRFEIQVGQRLKPDMKVYSDGNPLELKTGDVVTVIVRKEGK